MLLSAILITIKWWFFEGRLQFWVQLCVCCRYLRAFSVYFNCVQ